MHVPDGFLDGKTLAAAAALSAAGAGRGAVERPAACRRGGCR